MNPSFFNTLCRCLAASLLSAWTVASAVEAAPKAAAAPAPAPAKCCPRSSFVDDAHQGKDPFFPDSIRRLQSAGPVGTNAPVQPVTLTQLQLKGISGSKLLPLALINNATIASGESAEVRSGSQTFKVRCREIRERSVIIEIEGTGEIRELKLREGM